MNNELLVKFNDNKEAVYFIAIGYPIKEAIQDIEGEANKKIIAFNWIRIENKWKTI